VEVRYALKDLAQTVLGLIKTFIKFWFVYKSQKVWYSFPNRVPTSTELKVFYFLSRANAAVASGRGFKAAENDILNSHFYFNHLHKERTGKGVIDSDHIYLDPGWVSNIGHMAMLSIFIKLEELNLVNRQKKTVFYSTCANEAVMKLYSQHFNFVRLNNHVLSKLVRNQLFTLLPMGAFHTFSGILNEYYAHNLAENLWQKQRGYMNSAFSKDEVLEIVNLNILPKQIREMLENPFVILHVREAVAPSNRSGNNSDISTYLPAIEYLISEGFTVIRMGDSSMTPIQRLDRKLTGFWEYCHSDIKCPEIDLYLWSHATFSICTGSGPAFIPNEFGVPSLYTNMHHPYMNYGIKGMFIPHKYKSISDGSFLSYDRVLESGFGSSWAEKQSDIFRVRNSPQDILEGVRTVSSLVRQNNPLLFTLDATHSWTSVKVINTMRIEPSFYNRNITLFN
jgi:putative glycosyltransferase (TIGR04372 family)